MKETIREIIDLTWPIMVGMLLQMFLGTVDLKFVSRLGTEAAAAVSLGTSTIGVIFVFTALIATSLVALVSQAAGRKDHGGVILAAGGGLLLSGVVGLALTLVLPPLAGPIVSLLFNPNPAVHRLTVSYLQVVFASSLFVFLSAAGRSILQGKKDTLTPLKILIFSNLVNIVLDPFFIFTLNMGIRGAAVATMIGHLIAAALFLRVLFHEVFGGKHIFIDAVFVKGYRRFQSLIHIGGYASLQQVTRPITGLLMFRIVYAVGGNSGTAAFGIGGQLFGYTFVFLTGLSLAVSILVGHAIGSLRIQRIEYLINVSMLLAITNVVVFGFFYLLIPEQLLGWFLQDPQVITKGVSYLKIVYGGLLFVPIPMVLGGVFNGAGATVYPMLASLVANLFFKVPVAYLLATVLKWGLDGVWAAIGLSVIVEAAVIWYFFKHWRATSPVGSTEES